MAEKSQAKDIPYMKSLPAAGLAGDHKVLKIIRFDMRGTLLIKGC